jgi:hypothetical protein
MVDFYGPASSADPSLAFKIWLYLRSAPFGLVVAVFLAPFAVVLATRFLSERVSEKINDKNERTVWRLPYWIPLLGHAFSLSVFQTVNSES